MKKWLLFICVVVTVSCGTQSSDDKIKEAFSEYANQNFDDPSKVNEVVSITYGDTLTNKSFADMVSELSVMSDSLESLYKNLSDKANSLANQHGSKVRYNQSFREDWMEYEESLKNSIEKRWVFVSAIMSNDFIPITKDSILNYKDFALLDFTLKYRIKENEGLKLKVIQGNIDLKTSNIYIGEPENTELLSFLKGVNQTIGYYRSMIETNSDVSQKAQKVISYFE